MGKYKIINDPVHGFISIPGRRILQIIDDESFQRLRQIAQMGLSHLVYPGAHHTRFQHALGAMYLMGKALDVLARKGVEITAEERLAALQAILLHDAGHGPFSHALEYAIVPDLPHEEMSLAVMRRINSRQEGALDMAIALFRNEYPKKFLHELISGQLDVDRLDYLQRDSFYTGVVEGRINAGRLIEMLTVHNDRLAVEEKGLYSVEKFIVSRRFMYWQVYMHKTSYMFEKLLGQTLRRARELFTAGKRIYAGEDLAWFLLRKQGKIDDETVERFLRLTDVDIWVHLKKWMNDDDKVLSFLARSIVLRRPFRIEISRDPVPDSRIDEIKSRVHRSMNVGMNDTEYLVLTGAMSNTAYDRKRAPIYILKKDGLPAEFSELTDHAYMQALGERTEKHYLIYPKNL